MNKFDHLLFKEKSEYDVPDYDEKMFYKYKKDIIILVEQLLREGKNVKDIPSEIVYPFHHFLYEAISFFDYRKRETNIKEDKKLECIPEHEILKASGGVSNEPINLNDYRYITIRDKFYTIDRFLTKKNIET